MAESDYITLESVIERTGRPLKALFEAAAAWRAVEKPTLILAKRIVYEPEHSRILLPLTAYERELGETNAHFRRLLATGAWAIEVWSQLGGPRITPQPDEASLLSIEVDSSGESLTLHDQDGGRLFYKLSAPAPGASAPKKAAAEPAKRRGRYGPSPKTFERVLREMRAMGHAELRAMKSVAMAATFGASRDTCDRAREKVLAE